MNRLLDMLRNEPAVVRGFITAVAGLIVAYGLAEAERVDLWVTAILALLPIISGLATRPAVTPNRQVAVRMDERDGAVTGEALPPEGQPVDVDAPGGATSVGWTPALPNDKES